MHCAVKVQLDCGTYLFVLEPGQALRRQDEPEILGAALDEADVV